MEKIKILVLNYEWPPLGGGASPMSYELTKRLAEMGAYDIDVVTMHFKELPKYEEILPNLRVHRVFSLRRKKEMCHPWEQLAYLISAYFKVRSLIKGNNYHFCHTHFIIPTGVLALVLKKQFGLPYLITPHGSDVLGYNPRFKKLYPLLTRVWKLVLNRAKKVISPSHFLRSQILAVYPKYNREQIIVIPNGIDTKKFTSQQKKPYIFSSGRLFSTKGFQYLIEAVASEDLGWEVHIAGDGPMRQELEALAKKSKTKVVMHGWLNNNGEEYKNLMEQASIYVLASEKENASIALLEAMSAGCAVITTNAPGCAETVGEEGILVDIQSSSQIKRALTELVADTQKLQRLQTSMRVRAKTKFEWGQVLNQYRLQYENCHIS
ncbi:MAG TPA: glycosyltransferase family 4 protein [Candidatus Paceibacterota bacterium]|nr:glycosyltransferase family 4 protein [Candidatus Paceibacterota bacterium]